VLVNRQLWFKSHDFLTKKSFDFNHGLNQWLKSARFKSANPERSVFLRTPEWEKPHPEIRVLPPSENTTNYLAQYVAWVEAYPVPSAILIHPPFGHNGHGPKIWGLCPLFGAGELGPHPTLSFDRSSIWPQQIWAENWGLCHFGGGGAGSPSTTMWPGARPTCIASFTLIHPTVWLQSTNVTNRAGLDRQTDTQATV